MLAFAQSKHKIMGQRDNDEPPSTSIAAPKLFLPWSKATAFAALADDAETKLVPSYLVSKRNRTCANLFMRDLSMRMANRIQLSSDAMNAYADAVERAFGTEVDYGQAVKFTKLIARAATVRPR